MNGTQYTTTRGNGHVSPEHLSPFDDLSLSSELDLERLRDQARAAGIDLSHGRIQAAIASKRARARNLARQYDGSAPPQWFAALERFIVSVGNTLVLALMLVLSYVLPPVAVAGLGYAEVQRVALGVKLFDPPRAYLMSVTAVSAYLGLLVVRANMARHAETPRYRFSLRLWARRLGYVFGVGRWAPQAETSAQHLDRAISRLGWLIVALGTVGTLESELLAFDGAWYRGLADIVTSADLVTFLALAGGCLLTAGLLAAMHFLTDFTFGKFAQLVPDSADFLARSADYSALEDRAERDYLEALIRQQAQNSPR